MGMEEQLIPMLRALPAGRDSQPLLVLRPYHLRWDTLWVTVRDSATLRGAEVQGSDKSDEVLFLDSDGHLLWIWRFDHAGERRPLETSDRYAELLTYLPVIRGLLPKFSRGRGGGH
jgi:hypothetical protein